MTPDTIRRVLWTPPDNVVELNQVLADHGARPWQIEIVGPVLETAIWDLDKKQPSEQ
jgi:ribonuclease D